jgi:hypothetical protein
MNVTTIFFNGMCVNHSGKDGGKKPDSRHPVGMCFFPAAYEIGCSVIAHDVTQTKWKKM